MTDPSFFPLNEDEQREESQELTDLFANRKSYFLQVPGTDEVIPLPGSASQFPGLSYVRYTNANTGEIIVVELRSGETFIMPPSGVPAEHFVFKIDTTLTSGGSSNSDQYYFPLAPLSAANLTIEWGDGQTTTVNTVVPIGGLIDLLHTYDTPGVYTIVGKPNGGTPALSMSSVTFGGTQDASKLTELIQWGYAQVGLGSGVMTNCVNLSVLGLLKGSEIAWDSPRGRLEPSSPPPN